MGTTCGGYMPASIQKAIDEKKKLKSFKLNSSEFDDEYLSYAKACSELSGAKNLKELTIKFDSSPPPQKLKDEVIEKMFDMLNSLKLDHLIVTGRLKIFNDPKWKTFWANTKIPSISFQDRLHHKGLMNFFHGHAKNKFTKKLVLKRHFSEFDILSLIAYSTINKSLETIHLGMIEEEEEYEMELKSRRSSGSAGDRSHRGHHSARKRSRSKSKEERKSPDLKVTMGHGISQAKIQHDFTKLSFGLEALKPMSFLAHNEKITSLNFSGTIKKSMAELILHGISVNHTLKDFVLYDVKFEKEALKALKFALTINTSITTLEVNYGLNDDSAMILFHAIKNNQNIKTLILQNCDFNYDGFQVLSNCMKENKCLEEVQIQNLKNLGDDTSNSDNSCKNLSLLLEGVAFNTSIIKFTVSLFFCNYFVGDSDIVFDDLNEQLCNSFETLLIENKTIEELQFLNLRFKGRIFDSLGKGLSKNNTLKYLNLKGNLMDWKDLASFTDYLKECESLKAINLIHNKVYKPKDIKLIKKGTSLEFILSDIKDTFNNISQFKSIEELHIAKWLFEYNEYPDHCLEIIKKAKERRSNDETADTILHYDPNDEPDHSKEIFT